ncbi:DNA recombination and repair protein RecF [Altererythrobacter epoxidivorans]|uniref:DNA replication and repair protein RecF n=1 Tax=Altererythrobacter epoxidivorans TaxID=361183 RepID=A0A0M3TA49_9SPHN|nr:DNA replication/repair protein RecF [Altererythrobacter epoxidivorans]ALE16146.1 DNA recombination and repair protein RecF [Altererythrobacter epoxidivorans]
MALDRISLYNFRNHAANELADTRQFNLLVGENGAGKTNVLEALSLLAPGRGLRRASLEEMVGPATASGFAIGASLNEQGHESARLGTYVEGERPGRRLVRINGAEASATSLGEWLAMGWLTPAMDRLFTDSAGARRRHIDRMALALDPAHARNVTRFEAALRERNKLLESGGDATWLAAIEVQVAEHGERVASGRSLLVSALGDELSTLPDQPFARPLLTYRAGGPMEFEALREEFRRQRGRDRAAGRALSGPHRDELEVVMAGSGQAAAVCSTGEQKAMLIAMTLAHASLAAEGRPGVLLLDEVAAHLDPVRRGALFDRLRQGRAQVWLTGTESGPFSEILGEAAVWQVAGGKLTRL